MIKQDVRQAYKYELNPNNTQKTQLEKCAYLGAFVYNLCARHLWLTFTTKEGKDRFVSDFDLGKLWVIGRNNKLEWRELADGVPSKVPEAACKNARQGLRDFLGNKKGKKGSRKSKSPDLKEEREFTKTPFTTGPPKYGDSFVTISRKIGAIRTKERIRITGRVTSATFSTRAGRWFVSFKVERDREIPENKGGVVGIDWGLNSFVTTSDGDKFIAPKPFAAAEKRLAKMNKRISHQENMRKKGTPESNNQKKRRARAAVLHKKVADQRLNFTDKLSSYFVKKYSVVVVEDLNISGMLKNRHLSKAIADAGAGMFLTMLERKSHWYGCRVLKAGAFYPSTQTCNVCGYRFTGEDKLKMSKRVFECAACGLVEDRDINAAKNLANLYHSGIVGQSVPELTPAESLKGEGAYYDLFTGCSLKQEGGCPPNPAKAGLPCSAGVM
jgi:putative transposase